MEAALVILGQRGEVVGEEGDVVGPLAHEKCLVEGRRSGTEDPERLVADFPPMAVRALEQAATPGLPCPGHLGKDVAQTGGDDDVPPLHRRATGDRDGPSFSVFAGILGGTVEERDSVGVEVAPSEGDEVVRRGPIPGDEAVGRIGRGVTWFSGVDDRNGAACSSEDERGAQARHSPTDDDDVVSLLAVHPSIRSCVTALVRSEISLAVR
jgi:hypothetical protein